MTRDAIYHLALAIGDLSPLYLDEEYAKKTRWGTLIAPPIIVQTMDTLRAVGHSGLPEGLPGVHSIWTGSYYEWKRPPMLGDRIRADSLLSRRFARRTATSAAAARSIKPTRRSTTTRTARTSACATIPGSASSAPRRRETKKYGDIQLAQWTPEDIDRFMEEYRNEKRTAERYWDDVKVGDELHRLIKGPLTPTAEIAFESYFGIYLVGNMVAANLYDKHPALMIPNEQGVPEPPQRVHWDNAFTQRLLGLPGAYDLGPERCSWLIQGMTNWIGDNGQPDACSTRATTSSTTWATSPGCAARSREVRTRRQRIRSLLARSASTIATRSAPVQRQKPSCRSDRFKTQAARRQDSGGKS